MPAFHQQNQPPVEIDADRLVRLESDNEVDSSLRMILEGRCKSYHSYAIPAVLSGNLDYHCYYPPSNSDGFCGYPWDPDPFSISTNKPTLKCSSTTQREVCIQSMYDAECQSGEKCVWKNDRCNPNAENMCQNQTTKISCENTSSKNIKIISADGTGDLFGIEIYLSPECSFLQSNDCLDSKVHDSCTWYEEQGPSPHVSQLDFNNCCQIPSPWCESIDLKYALENTNLSVGTLTCENSVGPRSSLDRSSAGSLAKSIDDRCCVDLSKYMVKASNVPTTTPSNDVHLSSVPSKWPSEVNLRPSESASAFPSLSHISAKSEPSDAPSTISGTSSIPSEAPTLLLVYSPKPSRIEYVSLSPTFDPTLLSSQPTKSNEPVVLSTSPSIQPSETPSLQISNLQSEMLEGGVDVVESLTVYGSGPSNRIITSAIFPLLLVAGLGAFLARRKCKRSNDSIELDEFVDPSKFEHVSPYESVDIGHMNPLESTEGGIDRNIRVVNQTHSECYSTSPQENTTENDAIDPFIGEHVTPSAFDNVYP